MLFALNYSPQAETLLRGTKLDVDLLKCPLMPGEVDLENVRALRPVYVHFGLNAGDGSLEQTDWSLVEEVLGRTGTPYVNVHLGATSGDAPTGGYGGRAGGIAGRLIEDVAGVVERFGSREVIVENVPYHGGAPDDAGQRVARPSVDPEVICGVIDETGCGFLLDTAHARITAHHLGMDEKEYVSRLPVGSLRELHVSGVRPVGKSLKDHMPLGPEDWGTTDWALDRILKGDWGRPWAVAFEYGGVGPLFEWRSDAAVLTEQAPRLRERLNAG